MKKEMERYSLHQLEGGKRAGRPQHDAADLSVVLQTAERRGETPVRSQSRAKQTTATTPPFSALLEDSFACLPS